MKLTAADLLTAYRMPSPALVAFRVVEQELHFGRAAVRLQIDQSQVSRLVQQFEHAIGCPVFERTTRRVSLNAEGQKLVPKVDAVLEALASLARTASSNVS